MPLFHIRINAPALCDNVPHSGYFIAEHPDEIRDIAHRVFGELSLYESEPAETVPQDRTASPIADLAKVASLKSAQCYLWYHVMIKQGLEDRILRAKEELDEVELPQRTALQVLLRPIV
jgi:hypothetical protein